MISYIPPPPPTAYQVCPYCGGAPHLYLGLCPLVKAIDYYEDGRVKRVEKFDQRFAEAP